uniref:Integrase catalytic domain-containing protein n=1 Tax=Fundulus heteroclitus TaxID=8078 RepID=A0A3Q2QXS5_FUNHE
MGSDLHKYIQQCPQCKGLKSSSPSKKAKLQSYQAGAPMDRLHLDILGPFPISSSGNKYILVIMDQFTRWVEAFPVPDQGAETTARMLVNNFLARFGAPLELHTDQGRNFESVLFKSICQLFQISKTRTTPYHPASNGQVERFNRTLLQMIRCYVDQNQKNWDEHLSLLTAAYRSAQNSSTGFSPNMLMLGREVHQPQELWLGLAERTWSEKDPLEYVHDLEKTLGEVHDMARQHLRGAQLRQKRTHDLRAKECSYNIGDLVYVKDNTKKLGFSPKLQPPWKGPCIIKAQLGPVLYEILTQRDKKVMHHDQLKPYTSDVIPAWVRRQRHVVLPQCQDVVPLTKHMTTSPTPTSDDPGSDSESKVLVGPPKLLRKKGKRQVAAR